MGIHIPIFSGGKIDFVEILLSVIYFAKGKSIENNFPLLLSCNACKINKEDTPRCTPVSITVSGFNSLIKKYYDIQ